MEVRPGPWKLETPAQGLQSFSRRKFSDANLPGQLLISIADSSMQMVNPGILNDVGFFHPKMSESIFEDPLRGLA